MNSVKRKRLLRKVKQEFFLWKLVPSTCYFPIMCSNMYFLVCIFCYQIWKVRSLKLILAENQVLTILTKCVPLVQWSCFSWSISLIFSHNYFSNMNWNFQHYGTDGVEWLVFRTGVIASQVDFLSITDWQQNYSSHQFISCIIQWSCL